MPGGEESQSPGLQFGPGRGGRGPGRRGAGTGSRVEGGGSSHLDVGGTGDRAGGERSSGSGVICRAPRAGCTERGRIKCYMLRLVPGGEV
jgi:hypothetical protein